MPYELSHRTMYWAIAPLGTLTAGGAGVVAASLYALVNQEVWKQHYLLCLSAGLSADIARVLKSMKKYDRIKDLVDLMRDVESTASRAQMLSELLSIFDVAESGAKFQSIIPRRLMSFQDFHGKNCRITRGQARIANASVTYFTLWNGSRFLSDELLYSRITGTASGIIPLAGHVLLGETEVLCGDGDVFTVANNQGIRDMRIEQPDRRDDPRLVDIQVAAHENPVMSMPSDILFDHDSARIRPEAAPALTAVAEKLNNRFKLPVCIVGHTDSTGSHAYNLDLSFRRAKATKDWFKEHGVYDADGFVLMWHGESNPIAPNRAQDGSDNPDGRARNRRVEIHMTGRYPAH